MRKPMRPTQGVLSNCLVGEETICSRGDWNFETIEPLAEWIRSILSEELVIQRKTCWYFVGLPQDPKSEDMSWAKIAEKTLKNMPLKTQNNA